MPIAPWPCASRPGITAPVVLTGPCRLISSNARESAWFNSHARISLCVPATISTRSTPCHCACRWPQAAVTALVSVKSSGTTSAFACAPATSRSLSALRADNATRAPAASSARAVAAPMPVDAPITHTRASGHAGSGGFRGASNPMSSAFPERQRNFADLDAEFRHGRAVQHRLLVDHVHPIVHVHLPGGTVHGHCQHVIPVQRVALRHPLCGTDHVAGGAAIAVAVLDDSPHPILARAVRELEVLVECALRLLPGAINADMEALEDFARAVLEHAPAVDRAVEVSGQVEQ